MERRIAAILAADMVGYSRLMEADEVGTLTRQKRHRIELIDPKIASHGGQVIKLTGDGLIAEFPSVVEAVQCAVTIQAEMAAREAEEPEDRRISYRIAINLGDVIFEDSDVYGDGVNIAARLEALADAGGIIVSGTAYDHLKANVDVGYEDLGEQQVKNIARPVRAWRVLLDPDKAGRVVTKPRPKPKELVALASALAALVIGAFWWSYSVGLLSSSSDRTAGKTPVSTSIVVLPFSNLSDEAGQYFVDGMTDDLIVRLAKIDGLFVISRNTAFTYKGSNTKAKDLGHDLGVQYVIEGSVRRQGGRVRINTQLVDALSEKTIWAEMFDRETVELFELQDEVTTQIVEAMKLKFDASVNSQSEVDTPKSLKVYDLYLKGMSELRQRRPEAFARARVYFENALDIEAAYPEAHAALAFVFWESQQHGWLADIGVENRAEAFDLVERHLELTRGTPTPFAHLVRSEWFSLMNRDSESAISEARMAIELDPSFVEAYIGLAGQLALAGRTEEALDVASEALKLDPVTPPDFHFIVGLAHIVAGKYQDAISALEAAVQDGNSKENPWLLLAAAYGHEGRLDKAATALAAIELNRKERGHPPFSANFIFEWPIADIAVRERLFEDLKKAGADFVDSPLVNGVAKRRLSGVEIRELILSTTAEGVVVDRSGKKFNFTWTVDSKGNMDFNLWGQIYKTQNTFYDDRTCNERGCSLYFELTDSEAMSWGHRHMIMEQTGFTYYLTIKAKNEAEE